MFPRIILKSKNKSEMKLLSNKHPNTLNATPGAFWPPPDAILQQMARILDSSAFRATTAQRSFLLYVVEKVLGGEADEIKGYSVATQVFGRGKDFDQATDPIVSIQANKLRRALEHYYLTAGRGDPIRIDIPKGTYVPKFHQQPGTGKEGNKREQAATAAESGQPWPTLLIRPLENLTGNTDLDYLCIGLATDLATEITRYREARVIILKSPGNVMHRRSDTTARFIVDGSIQKDGNIIKVSVCLVDAKTGLQIWSEAYPADLEAGRTMAYQEKVAGAVAANIASEAGVISNALSSESKNKPPNELENHDAILRFYEFSLKFTPDAFFRAYDALTAASKKEPDCGLVWSMLARLYAVNYSLELFDLETPIETAVSFAAKGVRLEPANQRVRLIMAYALMLKGDIGAGLAETERGYRLNPNSILWLENIGYLMTLLGDWHRGPALIRKAMKHNPYYSVTAHHALWADWVRQEKYREAYNETRNFRLPRLFWDPLLKAAACGLRGNLKEGRQAADTLLALKPDFPQRGLMLIRYYIKFDDIVERTINGLANSGLELSYP